MDNISTTFCNRTFLDELETKEELPQIGYDIIAVVYMLLSVAAVGMNSVLIALFLSYNSIRKTENMLIVSIAVSDLLVALATYPLGARASLSRDARLRGGVCSYYACVSTVLGLNAMLHFTALSIQKYLSFTRPLRTRITRTRMLSIIIAMWLFSTLWGSFPLFGWSSFAPEAGNIVCSINWASKEPTSIAYIIAIFILFFFLPLIAILCSYFFIFRTIRRMTKNAERAWGLTAQGTRDTFMAQLKSVRIAFIMVFGFLFAWTPYAVISLYSVFFTAKSLPLIVGILTPLFAKTSTIYNPILCFLGWPTIRKCLFKAVKGFRSRRSSMDARTSSELARKSSFRISYSRKRSERYSFKMGFLTQKYGTTIV